MFKKGVLVVTGDILNLYDTINSVAIPNKTAALRGRTQSVFNWIFIKERDRIPTVKKGSLHSTII